MKNPLSLYKHCVDCRNKRQAQKVFICPIPQCLSHNRRITWDQHVLEKHMRSHGQGHYDSWKASGGHRDLESRILNDKHGQNSLPLHKADESDQGEEDYECLEDFAADYSVRKESEELQVDYATFSVTLEAKNRQILGRLEGITRVLTA